MPILRRDPTVNNNMQKWITQQLKLVKRVEAGGWSASQAAKKAYLAKLGLEDKLKDVKEKRPWHLDHIRQGDVFFGSIEHPEFFKGERTDMELTATSETEGTLSFARGEVETAVKLDQDFPIAYEKGPQRDMDMATYVFHKFNAGWRDFAKPVPAASDMERLSLKGLRMFFYQVAQAENFPDEADFNAACSDPSLGMTREEFIQYLKSEDEGYLDGTFPSVFTGRRLRISDDELFLDGDFQKDADNLIYGYVTLNGEKGGTFQLELKLGQ